MPQEKVIKITNRKQFECLVKFMKENVELAKGSRYVGSKEIVFSIWKEISSELNSLGPPIRTEQEWQKVWTDLKLKVKKKLAHNKKEMSATGGGPNKLMVLSSLEESVADMLSLDKLINVEGRNFGINYTSNRNAASSTSHGEPSTLREELSTPRREPSTSHRDPSTSRREPSTSRREPSTPRREPSTPRGEPSKPREGPSLFSQTPNLIASSQQEENGLKRNISSKENFGELRKRLLETQTNYLKEIVSNTTDCARHLRKIYELKEKKLKLYKEYLVRKENRSKREFDLQVQLFDYKKRKLEIREEILLMNNSSNNKNNYNSNEEEDCSNN